MLAREAAVNKSPIFIDWVVAKLILELTNMWEKSLQPSYACAITYSTIWQKPLFELTQTSADSFATRIDENW